VFSQSCVEVSASLTNVGSLAVGAVDLVNCSLSVVGSIPVFHVRIPVNSFSFSRSVNVLSNKSAL